MTTASLRPDPAGTAPTGSAPADSWTGTSAYPRLTTMAHGGGCACKIPPGELEDAVRSLTGQDFDSVIVGLDDGDDAAAVRVQGDLAVLSTADFFTPVVDDPFDWGRIAAANALSDIYAMGGEPVVAINLVGWPREVLPMEMLGEVLRGGLAVGTAAGCPVIGGHSVDDPEPKYGMAVTGIAQPDRILRNDAAQAGLPLTLTKPLGVGLLNNRHKATGAPLEEAIAWMTTLNRDAARAAAAEGARAATDVTGFGLLGHLHKMARASKVSAVIDRAAVPAIEGALDALAGGFISGGTRRNLDWVRSHLRPGTGITEEDLLFLADAQTSGGLLVVGEVPGFPVIGEVTAPSAEVPAGAIAIR
ncbi:MAG: selenide, water dikinase SelD [Dermabacter sp.]|nr:selenide, water dikinase SelD [Dermabacter sp.]